MTRVCPICEQKALITWNGRLIQHGVPRCSGSGVLYSSAR